MTETIKINHPNQVTEQLQKLHSEVCNAKGTKSLRVKLPIDNIEFGRGLVYNKLIDEFIPIEEFGKDHPTLVFLKEEGYKVVVEIYGKLYVLVSELKKHKMMTILDDYNHFMDTQVSPVYPFNERVTIDGNNQLRTLLPFSLLLKMYNLPENLWTIRWKLINFSNSVKQGDCKVDLDPTDQYYNEAINRQVFAQS